MLREFSVYIFKFFFSQIRNKTVDKLLTTPHSPTSQYTIPCSFKSSKSALVTLVRSLLDLQHNFFVVPFPVSLARPTRTMCQQYVFSTPPAIVPGLAGHSLLELKDCWNEIYNNKKLAHKRDDGNVGANP